MTPETLIQMDSAAQVEAVAPEKVWDMMKAIEIASRATAPRLMRASMGVRCPPSRARNGA